MQDRRRRFEEARLKVLGELGLSCGIGRLSEKSIHKVLKNYIEPDESCHEVKLLGSYADVVSGGQIYEIQTRSAWRLSSKLEKLLSVSRVCVVIPVIVENLIRRLDRETGEISSGRKSVKKENAFTALGELYGIRSFLTNPNFEVRLIFLKAEDFRYREEQVKGEGRGASKIDKIPTELVDDIRLSSHEDYLALLPQALEDRFLEKDLRRAAGYPAKFSSAVICVLKQVGVIRQIGKQGRFHLYEKIKTHTDA